MVALSVLLCIGGLWVGVFIGMFVAAMCQVSAMADKQKEYERRKYGEAK